MMYVTREQAAKALKMTDNNIEQAVGWIFAHPGDLNQDTASESQVVDDVFSDNDDIITPPQRKP